MGHTQNTKYAQHVKEADFSAFPILYYDNILVKNIVLLTDCKWLPNSDGNKEAG